MYSSSTSSSSSKGSLGPTGGIIRGGSGVDSATRDFSAAIGPQTSHPIAPALFFPSHELESQSGGVLRRGEDNGRHNSALGLQPPPSYGFPASLSSSSSSSLARHNSSPSRFVNKIATAAGENGFSVTRGISESSRGNNNISRMSSQLSFNRPEAHTNQSMFSMAPSKGPKHMSGAIDESHEFGFIIPQGAVEMATMEKLLHIPQDSVPCKLRAKRGCATHPRSIAERERRTRISGKLKKLQDLVPNMDKQTSYADMLDLAVQHIKTLQTQVQKLNKELDSCTCGCKKSAGEHK